MEQRRLRLGDILDDYCPRERRLTNHAVVAMIEENVKQTRCTTCDAEHPYKGGKVPRRRKAETTAALYKEVLASHLAPDAPPADPDIESDAAEAPIVVKAPVVAAAAPIAQRPAQAADENAGEDAEDATHVEGDAPAVEIEEGPVHRPLIRAQLPRIEGHKEERRPAEFTIRQRSGNGQGFRGGGDARMKPHRPGSNGHAGNGGGANRGPGGPRFAGPRPAGSGGGGQPGRGGPAAGFRTGQPRPGGGGRKRSR